MEMDEEKRAKLKKMVATAQLMLAMIKSGRCVCGFLATILIIQT